MNSAVSPSRRALLMAALAAAAWATPAGALPPRRLAFPRDFGSHPDLRTEWWYITGHATSGAREFGFQLTFFRSRIDDTQSMRSAFAAKQLIFAHAAITDLEGRRLWHDQRIARAGFGIASASETDTDIRLRDWSLRREGDDYAARLPASGFAIDLRFAPTQPLLLQGDAGLSRKGPDAEQASYYYSEPQLAASGSLTLQGRRFEVQGRAWLDHEWSEAILHPDAVGWDWIGMNLFDGGALTAFRLRRRDGTALWFGGSMRTADGRLQVFGPDALRFEAEAHWTSPRTRAVYPTRWRIETPAGVFRVRALLDDQELDGDSSTGTVYWEGLSELLDADGKPVGRGYLELTGYAQALKL
ncbi:carotenoid 1,2-hydratase [Variovorax sp. J22P168]|uniref:lipocalin-like domain-containing protein n=1 Tax=Variovorax jilinensis TaxID=3053513 RepID=UPI00257596DC|nr:carotenoid 1,2-hydratase [Variovorax sp. J22P168]MDM0012971.1 carotenoid 1,2-hydratase [Variovorax sp. J22P168]